MIKTCWPDLPGSSLETKSEPSEAGDPARDSLLRRHQHGWKDLEGRLWESGLRDRKEVIIKTIRFQTVSAAMSNRENHHLEVPALYFHSQLCCSLYFI